MSHISAEDGLPAAGQEGSDRDKAVLLISYIGVERAKALCLRRGWNKILLEIHQIIGDRLAS